MFQLQFQATPLCREQIRTSAWGKHLSMATNQTGWFSAELCLVSREWRSWAADPQLVHLGIHGLEKATGRHSFMWKYGSEKPCHHFEWFELKGWKGWSQREERINQLLSAGVDGSQFWLMEASQTCNWWGLYSFWSWIPLMQCGQNRRTTRTSCPGLVPTTEEPPAKFSPR